MRSIPFAVWRLTAAFALMMAGTSMLVLIAGIIGTEIAPTAGLATLPVALGVVGVAAATLPTGRLLHHFGRRKVFIAYGLLAIFSAFLASYSLAQQNFSLFSVSSFLVGWSAAAGHQYRFAALESVVPEMAPKATSALLMGGLMGAFIGPELAVRGRWLLESEYSGSFLLLACSYLAGVIIVSFHRDLPPPAAHGKGSGRPLSILFKRPVIVLAVSSAAVAYGVMSFIMTATPISMHQHDGHSLEATKIVIQSHIAAMYLPSLLFGLLFSWLGFRGMLLAGTGSLAACLMMALVGNQVVNYWLALVFLGIGWNFMYLTATNLLPYGYQPEERFRVQSTNDFIVFTVQAVVSLSSGWFLFQWNWAGLLWLCLPPLVLFLVYLGRVDFLRLLDREELPLPAEEIT